VSSPNICPSCGATIEADAKTCGKCGFPILGGRDTYGDLVAVGELTVRKDRRIVEFTLQTCFSAYIGNPGNLAPEAPTSEGKTYGVVEPAKLFPKNDVWFLGGLSPTALANDYGMLVDEAGNLVDPQLEAINRDIEEEKEKPSKIRDKDKIRALQKQRSELLRNAIYLVDMENKTLIFLDEPDPETLVRLRPIMSHDVFDVEYRIAAKSSQSSQWRTRKVRIHGWPAFILIRAKSEKRGPEWEQIASRFTTIAPKMGNEKYRAAVELTAEKKGLPSPIFNGQLNLKTQRAWAQNAIVLIRDRLLDLKQKAKVKSGEESPNLFWFPYAGEIGKAFPADAGRHMRDSSRFMTALQMSAAINIFARPLLVVDDAEYIIATRQDFQRAVDLYFGDAAERGTIFSGIPRHVGDFFLKVVVPLGQRDPNWFYMQEMVNACPEQIGKTLSSNTIRLHYLPYLQNAGLVDDQPDPDDKRRYVFRLLKETLDPKSMKQEHSVFLRQKGNDDIFSLEKLKEAWNELNKIASPKSPISIHNFDGSELSVDELFSSYFRENDDAISITSEQRDSEEREKKIASPDKRREMTLFSQGEEMVKLSEATQGKTVTSVTTVTRLCGHCQHRRTTDCIELNPELILPSATYAENCPRFKPKEETR